MTDLIAPIVLDRVNEAMKCEFPMVLARINGDQIDNEERREVLSLLFGEIHRAIGQKSFQGLPIGDLDQFSVMSAVRDQSSGGLLETLIKTFIAAYANPQTTDRAIAMLEGLQGLGEQNIAGVAPAEPTFHELDTDLTELLGEIATEFASFEVHDDPHSLPDRPASVAAGHAARKLETNLRSRFPEHDKALPSYALRFKQDAIVILSSKPLENVPTQLEGVAIEVFVTSRERLIAEQS